MIAPLLEMHDVFKHYPEKYALEGVNFNMPAGKVVGLLGRNGSGKTTLIECALGLREINQGEIRLMGEVPMSLSEGARGRIGYVPQQNDLFEWLTPTQMLAFFKAFYTRWNDTKVSALLDRWSIPVKTPIGKLSGGERQRLAIIRALAHDPEFLVLDEPVASLDPAGRRDFLKELVTRTIEKETSILFSTHILSDLERVAVEAAFMRQGKVVLQRPLDELAECTFRIVGRSELLLTPFAFEFARSEADGLTNVVVAIGELEQIRIELLRGQGIRVEPIGLEDLFIEVTK